jgi:peptidoglycan hydrolase-like protein with peptidoglycan-binding domain
LLIAVGYSITADGNFGTGTETALKAFQTSAGLTADGLYGPTTKAALEAAAAGSGGGTTILRKGDTGRAVAAMQTLLIAVGYNLGSSGADGVFGTGTETALKAFQTSVGLTADGLYGPTTKAALEAAAAGSGGGGGSYNPSDMPILRLGDSGDSVVILQERLIAEGYNLGSAGADGVFGSATDTAVKAFQNAHSLTADGIVGLNTWTALLG